MAGLEGTRLGAYELMNSIGSGGMAEVYRARQSTAFNREVAVKVIRSGFSEDSSFRERFLREAQAITRLSHPNILPLIEFGETNGILYLVMPLAREGSLRDLLTQRNGPLRLEEAIPLFTQLCNAVEYAHTEGIIHRDIKPQNVLLQSYAHVLLCDFGIARDLAKTNITMTGTGVGTVEYMAPEQAIGRTDMRSDIYSLGVLLYQLLTGLVPYRGSTPFQVLMQHTNEPLPDPRQINPHVPEDALPVLQQALAKDPEQRFQSAQALGNAMQDIGPDAATLVLPSGWHRSVHGDGADRSGQRERLPIADTGPTQPVTGKLAVALLPSPPIGVTSQPPEDSSRDAVDIHSEDANRVDRSRAWNNGGPVINGHGSGSQPPRWSDQPTFGSGSTPAKKHHRGRRALLFTILALVVLVIAVRSASFAYSLFDQGRTSQGERGAISPGSAPTATLAPSSSKTTATPKTPAQRNTATPVDTIPTTQPTIATTVQPVVFSVTGVSAVVTPNSFHGACAATMLFTFTGTITVPTRSSGGTVSYTWLRSDGAVGPAETVNFNVGVTTQTVTTTWQLGSVWGNGTAFWEALRATAPNSITSAHANFSFVCQNQNTVTSIDALVSPGTYDCSQSVQTFNFNATINISPGSNGTSITYTWARSDGATMSPITVSVPAGQTTVSVTDTWTLGVGAPAGTYWEQVVVTSPNNSSSNQATFSKPC